MTLTSAISLGPLAPRLLTSSSLSVSLSLCAAYHAYLFDHWSNSDPYPRYGIASSSSNYDYLMGSTSFNPSTWYHFGRGQGGSPMTWALLKPDPNPNPDRWPCSSGVHQPHRHSDSLLRSELPAQSEHPDPSPLPVPRLHDTLYPDPNPSPLVFRAQALTSSLSFLLMHSHDLTP